MDTVIRRNRNWIGHIIRGKEILTTVLEGTVERERKRGRKKLKLIDDKKEDMKELRKRPGIGATVVNRIWQLAEHHVIITYIISHSPVEFFMVCPSIIFSLTFLFVRLHPPSSLILSTNETFSYLLLSFHYTVIRQSLIM